MQCTPVGATPSQLLYFKHQNRSNPRWRLAAGNAVFRVASSMAEHIVCRQFCWEAHEKCLSLKSVTKPANTQFCQRWSDQGYGYEDDRDPMNGLLSPGAPGVTWSSTRYWSRYMTSHPHAGGAGNVSFYWDLTGVTSPWVEASEKVARLQEVFESQNQPINGCQELSFF